MSRLDLGDFSSETGDRTELWCESCDVAWTGDEQAGACPQCGNDDVWRQFQAAAQAPLTPFETYLIRMCWREERPDWFFGDRLARFRIAKLIEPVSRMSAGGAPLYQLTDAGRQVAQTPRTSAFAQPEEAAAQ